MILRRHVKGCSTHDAQPRPQHLAASHWRSPLGRRRAQQCKADEQHSAWGSNGGSKRLQNCTASAYNSRASSWKSQGGGGTPDPDTLTYENALGRALRLVNYRERTAFELEQKLLEDGYPAEMAQEAVEHVKRAGLQSDERFAEQYARGQWRRTLRAPVRIRMELKAKGVSTPLIEAALQKVFGSSRAIRPSDLSSFHDEGEDLHQEQWEPDGSDADEEEEDEDAVREHDAWALILQESRKRAALTTGEPADKRKAKLARWLQARGHSWDTVSKVVHALRL